MRPTRKRDIIMKKTLCLLITMFCVLLVTAQQNVDLKFTATYSDGTYHPFDYISVTNVTRGWNELLAYPDTTMSLTYDGLFENYTNGGLTEAFPNPFYGKADVVFSMDRTGVITAKLLTISGKVLSEFSGYIEEGSHHITINIDKPQMAFLVVKTDKNQYVKKVLNIGYGGRNSIIVNKTCDNGIANKQRSGGEFVPGDVMSYMVISTISGNNLESDVITKEQYNSETIVLVFSTPIVSTSNVINITTNTAVSGGVVTSEGGSNVTARGVCWSTSQNPTINDSHTTDGSGMGSFISNITGLTGATTYYLRAYATNEIGTSYGLQVCFATAGDIPIVNTNNVTNVTASSAICGGNVINDNGLNVTARGVCWSTTQNPTINNNHTTDGSGTGSYNSVIANLTYNTTYYVRAYATNGAGTAYGSQKTFITENVVIPTVTTDDVTNIQETTATMGGNVVSNGNGTISDKGVCWSTIENPTINNSHASCGAGGGQFSINIFGGLTNNTTYYVRAYAINEAGIAYGGQKTFTTLPGIIVPTGAINSLFSVSATQQVYFSQGNLQYIGSASTPYWKFADHQWDCLDDNGQSSSNNNVDRDLFGWATSGYNHGAVCYQPWSTSTNNSYYYAYGISVCNLNTPNGQADWGYNAIANGGNTQNEWRTLTDSEWYYVFETRNTTSGIRYAMAKVNGINGVILLPDNWANSIYNLHNTNSQGAYTNNVISLSVWNNTLEAHGAVFLPVASYRYGTAVYTGYPGGYYWSATAKNNDQAYSLSFDASGFLSIGDGDARCYGNSVRLVHDF